MKEALKGSKRGNIGVAVAVLGGVFMIFLLAGIYLLVMSKIKDTLTADSVEANAVGDGISAIADSLSLGAVLPIVGFAVAVIGLVALFGGRFMGGR